MYKIKRRAGKLPPIDCQPIT